jgi:hypothetical protein
MKAHPMKTHYVKQQSSMPRGLLSALAGFALCAILFAAPVVSAQDLIVDSFPNAASVGIGNSPGLDWVNYRGYNVTVTWDPTQNSTGSTTNGSMYVTVDWPEPSDPDYTTAWTDMQFGFSTGGAFNASNYIAFDCDIKVDVTNSFTALDGTYGAIELIVNDPWQNVNGFATLEATGEWQHFTGFFSSISPPMASSYQEAIVGLISQGGGACTNTISYWIDNIVFTALPTVNTNQPTLSIGAAPPPGLTCICSQGGGTYQRQIVETVNDDYSWNTASGASNTSTYSVTIAAFPPASYSGFADQLFLIPQSGMIGTPQDDDIDWDSADVAALYVGANPDQTATGTFQYKVNQSSSWNTSLVVTKSCATGPLGTWSLTFNNNTNVTLTAPDNTSTNFTMAASDAALFVNPLYVYLGDQPNANANIGQSSTFSQLTITGASDSIDDNFASDGTLNTNTWANDTASDENGIFVTAPDATLWVTWPTPDGGFTNVYATDNLTNQIGNAQWVSLPSASTGWVLVGGAERLTVINQSTLNTAFGYQPTNCFFGLWHQ